MSKKIYSKIPLIEEINKTMSALKQNGMEAYFVPDRKAAKEKVLQIIPKGSEVMNMTSVTLDSLSLSREITNSNNYKSIRKILSNMNRETEGLRMQQLGTAPSWAIGSVHAITQNGQVIIASNTGSQLPSYAYGATGVIWVVGVQKIVTDLNQGMDRIYQYVLPLESKRAKKAYGASGSNVSKLLIINKEIKPGRVHIILVNEVLGF
ncbi:LUD domain-containing protein [Candidatus Daviesbacteria bacterium]|nr:LUD domain-containing protein [Candidatus Daviesbacteria bacterium]